MADNTIDIDILINTSKSAKSLKEQKEALKGLRDGLDQVREGSGAFELLTDAANDLTGQMDNLKLSFEEVYGEGVKPLTNQIGELEDRLYQMAIAGQQNTQEFKDLKDEAARLKLAIRDVDDEVDSLSTRGRALEQFTGAIQGIAGAFAVAQGAAALFGNENEDFEKTMTKLTGVMAVMQGLQEVQNQLTTKGTVLNRVYNAVLKANPIFILLGVITAVIGAWKLFGSTTEDITDKVAKLNSNLQLQQDILEYNTTLAQQNSEAQLALAEAEGASAQEILDLKLDIIQQEKIAEANKWKLANDAIEANKKLRSDAIIEGNDEAQQAAQEEIDRNKQIVDSIELDFKERAGYANKYELDKALLRKQFNTEELKAQEELTAKNKEAYNKRVEDIKKAYDEIDAIIRNSNDRTEALSFDFLNINEDIYVKQLNQLKKSKTDLDKANKNAFDNDIKTLDENLAAQLISLDEYTKNVTKLTSDFNDRNLFNEAINNDNIQKLRQEIRQDFEKDLKEKELLKIKYDIDKEDNDRESYVKRAKAENKSYKDIQIFFEVYIDKKIKLLEKSKRKELEILALSNIEEQKLLDDRKKRVDQDLNNNIISIEESKDIIKQISEERSLLEQKSTIEEFNIKNKYVKLTEEAEKESYITRHEAYVEFMTKNAALIDSSTQLALDGINAVMELENRKTEERLANIETEKNAAFDALDKERDLKRALAAEDSQAALAQLAEQRTLAEERQAIQDEADAKSRAAKKDQWVKQKRADVITSVINGALAISKALASAPPPLNFVLAGIAGAAAGVQTGLIASQPTPIFRRGGILDGPSHENGGILTQFGELEGGEAIINKKSTKLFAPMLSAINEAGGGKSFAPQLSSNKTSTTNADNNIERLEAVLAKYASRPIKTYVNESEITSSQNNVKKLRERNSF